MASDGRLDTTWVWPFDAQVELGVERAVAQLGDDDPIEADAEAVEHVLHEVVRHRSGRLDLLEREGDRGGLGTADEDRQRAMLTFGLAQQDDRSVGGQLDPDADQLHLDHHWAHPTPRGRETRVGNYKL